MEDETAGSHPTCPICLTHFKQIKCFKQHRCLIETCPDSDSADLEVKDSIELDRILASIRKIQSQPRDMMQFCLANKIAIPGFFPMFFLNKRSRGCPILTKLGSMDTETNYGLLKSAVKSGPLKLPKELKIKFDNKVLKIHASLLIPTSKSLMKNLTINITSKNIRIKKVGIGLISLNNTSIYFQGQGVGCRVLPSLFVGPVMGPNRINKLARHEKS